MAFRTAVALCVCLWPAVGCVSAATYERDLADARTEAKVAQQSVSLQAESFRTALAALQRSLEAEAELRAMTVRTLEAQINRLEASQRHEAPSGGEPVPKGKGEVVALRAELQRMREQDEAATARIRRLEETIQQLSRTKAIVPAGADLDVRNPWSKLHAYPY